MVPLFEELLSSINRISDAPPPKPFPHLASSFLSPTTKEVIAIKDAIRNSSSHEESIKKLLSRLKDVETTLQARLNAERGYKSYLRGTLSTMRLLPPEVLSNIFLYLPEKIDNHSKFMLNHSVPWFISRVCRKWRDVCLSTPRLWIHGIPTIYLNRQHTSGFFELLKTATELSFPHGISLRLRQTNAENIERFEDILPHVHSLDVHVDLPMIKGLVQRKGNFKRLKSAIISFTSNSSEEPPILDFLSPVTSLTLSCRHLQRRDSTPYVVLRSVDSHWPNLTTFHGVCLPSTFLRCILFAAPLLREVTMHNTMYSPLDSTAPTSDVCHANLKYLSLTCGGISLLPDGIFQHLHLPGLENLNVEHEAVSQEPFLSFLQGTRGSLVELSLKGRLGTLDNQREMYKLCPALNTLTLGDARLENLGILAVSPQSKLCPALRHLRLHNFALLNDDDACVFGDFCSSRGLAPFTTPNPRAESFQLDRITVYMDDPDMLCQEFLRVNFLSYSTSNPFRSALLHRDTVRLSPTIPILQIFTRLLSDIFGLWL